MGDGESSANNSSCRSSPVSLADHQHKLTDAINTSRDSSPPLSGSVKEEESGAKSRGTSSPCGNAINNKPSAHLSFSIARLINTPMPSADDDNSPTTSPAPDHRPSASQASTVQAPPVYPIPMMWAPTTTSGTNATTATTANTRPSAFASQMMAGYLPAQPLADVGGNGASFNQMLRNVLMHQPTDALAALMRHYQQQFYAGGHALPFAAHAVGPLPPALNLSAANSSGTSSSAANLHKVEILRSAASASLHHHQQNRPTPLLAPHRLHGKTNLNMQFSTLGLNIKWTFLFLSKWNQQIFGFTRDSFNNNNSNTARLRHSNRPSSSPPLGLTNNSNNIPTRLVMALDRITRLRRRTTTTTTNNKSIRLSGPSNGNKCKTTKRRRRTKMRK